MILDDVIADYCEGFFGFGRWDAKVWFVGMEEGGGGTEAEVANRLASWCRHGRKELECAPAFYPACGVTGWHGADARLQYTWKQLVRMLLLAKGAGDTNAELLDYQKHLLGKATGETCLTELLPLPSPNTRTWLYHNWSTLPWLRNREVYQSYVQLSRACQLRERISRYRPSVVIFYGSSWQRTWASIARVCWNQEIPGELMGNRRDGTSYFVTRHPARQSDEYFRMIGNYLRKAIQDSL